MSWIDCQGWVGPTTFPSVTPSVLVVVCPPSRGTRFTGSVSRHVLARRRVGQLVITPNNAAALLQRLADAGGGSGSPSSRYGRAGGHGSHL